MVNFTPRLVDKDQAASLEDLVVDEIMHRSFLRFEEDMFVDDVLKLLSNSSEIGGPVLTKDAHLVGFVSEKTCLEMLAVTRFYNCEAPIVSHFMSQELHSVPTETPVYKLMDLFLNNWFHTYPVLKHGKVIGVVNRKMLLKIFEKEGHTTWWGT